MPGEYYHSIRAKMPDLEAGGRGRPADVARYDHYAPGAAPYSGSGSVSYAPPGAAPYAQPGAPAPFVQPGGGPYAQPGAAPYAQPGAASYAPPSIVGGPPMPESSFFKKHTLAVVLAGLVICILMAMVYMYNVSRNKKKTAARVPAPDTPAATDPGEDAQKINIEEMKRIQQARKEKAAKAKAAENREGATSAPVPTAGGKPPAPARAPNTVTTAPATRGAAPPSAGAPVSTAAPATPGGDDAGVAALRESLESEIAAGAQ